MMNQPGRVAGRSRCGVIVTILGLVVGVMSLMPTTVQAQLVCLPAPRLLTMTPMGGQVGTQVEVTITGEYIEDTEQLRFSHPGITATAVTDAEGQPVPNRYVVSIASDCPPGVHEARVMSRLGISSSRVFSVGELTETTQAVKNTTLDKAIPLQLDSVCNAVMTSRAIDYYSFEATQGQRVVVDCAAAGIDSKLKPVVIIADARGADLLVERRGGTLDFTAPAEGRYVIKVHELTYQGGSAYFYRLAIRAPKPGDVVASLPATRAVSSFSWPPVGLSDDNRLAETEPNNAEPQQITLPCDISGSFFPAADVDTFEFTAEKGEVWWVEVASERLGCPTDASIVVQHISGEGEEQKLTDVAELSDIPSPVKVSSNGYSYDGPPYNAGSTDILGKLEIKESGRYRLQIRDLFGGTRNDPRNIYRLIIRRAAPDFAVVGWALHMNLRNGDRNALSKPIALRGGATMPIEVVVVRRDGFDGPIDLNVEGLPEGVTATGLQIAPGQSRGILLVTADADAPRGLAVPTFTASATIDGELATRPCHMASMKWPVKDASSEIPSPRLLADVPVSVSGREQTPVTIAAAEEKVWEVTEGQTLKIPLVQQRRSDFSGATISLKTFGAGFERVPAFDASLKEDASEAVINFSSLKLKPGDYRIAFYGSAVAKYRYNVEAETAAQAAVEAALREAATRKEESERLAEAVGGVAEDEQASAAEAAAQAATAHKAAQASVTAAQKALKTAAAQARPKDIVDIVVSRPITVRVKPAEKK